MKLSNRSLLHVFFVGGTLALATASLMAMPFDSVALAKNGGGNGGGHGGDHGGAGNSGDHGSGGKSGSQSNNGAKSSADQDEGDADAISDIPANALGKLNGLFHASPTALDNASANSAPGSISQALRELLNDYAEQEQVPEGEVTEGEDSVELDDLAEVLADASNKPMTPEIVDKILDRLTDVYGDDYSGLTDPDEAATEGTGEETAEPTFSEALSERVNEINGYDTPEEEGEQDPS